jgi:DNA repair protein RadA/Sms
VPGTCVTVCVEGRRPLLAEVQALVAKSTLPSPRRAVSGLDAGRVAMVLAVTERRGGVQLAANDVYTATVGGMRLTEPASDLALALAVASAVDDKPLPADLVALGELGLSGELRPVPDLPRRLAEAARLGFRRAVVPLGSETAAGIALSPVSDLGQALVALENMRRPPAPRRVGLTLA